MKIAVIGLGNMGGGMAANLAKAGHDVNAFDLNDQALARAKDNGCAASLLILFVRWDLGSKRRSTRKTFPLSFILMVN